MPYSKEKKQKSDSQRFGGGSPKTQGSWKKPKKTFGHKKEISSDSKILPKDSLIGVYKQVQGSFGFVDTITDGIKKGYFVHESQKKDALEGDEVAFQIRVFKGREEALILQVLKRSENCIVGTLKINGNFAFVIPEGNKGRKDVFIPGKFLGAYTDGSQVAVKIVEWNKKNPEGRIVEALESFAPGRRDIYTLALQGGARVSFPSEVKEELKKLSPEIPEGEMSRRRDMTSLLTFTIDGAESKDLDDALSLESLPNGGIKLFVHIADVAHYVREGTALDKEALKRGTSIYLCDQVIPMLPKEISNGTCSLHPGEKKLTLTCEMDISASGQILESRVYETIIVSDFRLTYSEVQEIVTPPQSPSTEGSRGIEFNSRERQPGLEASESEQGEFLKNKTLLFGGKLTPQLTEALFLLKKLRDTLGKHKREKGMLDFDFPETKIELDNEGNPIDFKEYERYDSYKMIEHAMVLANEAVAREFHSFPFLYRVHEVPQEEDVAKFERVLESQTGNEYHIDISPKGFQKILDMLQADEKLFYLQRLFLRSLTKARYSEKNAGHFGLASDGYSHFTSPIRRYPDLQIHRIMKEILQKQGEKYLSKERNIHYKTILPEVARICSEREQVSEKLEYRVRDMMAAKWMADKVGQTFSGRISGMISKGFFVELPNTIEGFIDISKTSYVFDEYDFVLRNPKTGEELHFGSRVTILLVKVDTQTFRIDFEFQETV